MVNALGRGSNSLNQRATTLAALAVAALGAFGVFSAHVEKVQPRGLGIAAAVLVGIASLALLVGASLALKSVLPGGRWTATFASRIEAVAEANMDAEIRSRHFFQAAKEQLDRNYRKATDMKVAYRLTGVALVAGTLAVLTTLVGSVV